MEVFTKLNSAFFHQFLMLHLRTRTNAPVLRTFIERGVSCSKQADSVLDSLRIGSMDKDAFSLAVQLREEGDKRFGEPARKEGAAPPFMSGGYKNRQFVDIR
jgi:hypothetical protein